MLLIKMRVKLEFFKHPPPNSLQFYLFEHNMVRYNTMSMIKNGQDNVLSEECNGTELSNSDYVY
jgi:hypothetical protein